MPLPSPFYLYYRHSCTSSSRNPHQFGGELHSYVIKGALILALLLQGFMISKFIRVLLRDALFLSLSQLSSFVTIWLVKFLYFLEELVLFALSNLRFFISIFISTKPWHSSVDFIRVFMLFMVRFSLFIFIFASTFTLYFSAHLLILVSILSFIRSGLVLLILFRFLAKFLGIFM